MTTKKSQGLSITTIIVAAIALIVLVVLIMIFTGKIRGFGEGIDNCAQKGGECKLPPNPGDERCPPDELEEDVYVTIKNTECDKEGREEVCCIKIL